MQTIYPTKEHLRLIEQFTELQSQLIPLWEHIGRTDPGSHIIEGRNTVIVVPSITVDLKFDIASQQAHEEGMLFMLFLLRQPNIHIIFLTSLPVAQSIVDYYLDILPSVTVSNARKRLTMMSPGDASTIPLIQKLLARPRLIEQIQAMIPDRKNAHIVPFLTTDLERDFAVRLQVPMYAADPQYFAFGTKSGCRRIFFEELVPHPLGAHDLRSAGDLVRAIAKLREFKPALKAIIVKHNNGVSGYGNATLGLEGLPAPGTSDESVRIADRLDQMKFELPSMDYAGYMAELGLQGGIVEEFLEGRDLLSPSAQLRVTPLGEIELLSTHDQLPSEVGGVPPGVRFPADKGYAARIMEESAKIGERLAQEGIVGRFAIDFIVVRGNDHNWKIYAIEVNLRKGGTTHPFLTLQYLTDGRYDAEHSVFRTAHGLEKYYVATDNLQSDAYLCFTPEDLFDVVSQSRLQFDHTTQTGVVLHMISGVSTHGRLGFTAIGNSPQHASDIFEHFVTVLDMVADAR